MTKTTFKICKIFGLLMHIDWQIEKIGINRWKMDTYFFVIKLKSWILKDAPHNSWLEVGREPGLDRKRNTANQRYHISVEYHFNYVKNQKKVRQISPSECSGCLLCHGHSLCVFTMLRRKRYTHESQRHLWALFKVLFYD